MNLITLNIELLAALAQKPDWFDPGALHFWDDPHIATQMLAAHIDPNIDAASRKPETIEKTVHWIIERAALTPGKHLLDLGCGPGLYTRRFAEFGLNVTGVDFSQNSLDYARQHDSRTTYQQANYVTLPSFENAFDVVTLIYGDICVLNDSDRDTVLQNICKALRPGGFFIFDVTTPAMLRGKESLSWSAEPNGGFWKPEPHLLLTQYFEYPDHDTALDRYLTIETSGTLTDYRVWTHHYTPDSMRPVLEAQGFALVDCYSDLMGTTYQPGSEWAGFVAQKV